jgi:hypothetical protein
MRGPEDTSAIASASFDEFVGASPEYAAALRDVENAVWNQTLVSPSILELCRLRIAQILGCTVALEHRTPQALADRFDEALADSLTSWPTSGCFDRRMRACLAYAEQLLVDAQEVSDELCSAVIDEIGRNCQNLWIGGFQATSDPAVWLSGGIGSGVMSVGRSSSLPLWKTAPARTRATSSGALTLRQRACAASMSL